MAMSTMGMPPTETMTNCVSSQLSEMSIGARRRAIKQRYLFLIFTKCDIHREIVERTTTQREKLFSEHKKIIKRVLRISESSGILF